MSGTLSGKSALVTVTARGIGRAIAEKLQREGAAVTGTRADGQVPEGCDCRAVDFTDTEATHAFADDVRSLGPDILINNAGINEIGPFADIDPEDFERIQQVNVSAPFALCQAVVPGMKAKGWGRIGNISSIWGKIAKAERGPYAASKFALDGMTITLAAEVGAFGVLANCVAPGFIDTELTHRVLGDAGIAKLTKQVPVGRLGRPDEIAAFVAWLASPENTYINGLNIAVDGGFTRV